MKRREADHFTDEAWLDFIKDVTPASEKAAIKKHLEAHCRECEEAWTFWRSVADVLSRESRYRPPAEAIRFANNAYAEWRWTQAIANRARTARVIFDSMLEPAASGTRGTTLMPRRIVERVGNWTIDLLLQPEGANRMSLDGQILRAGKHTADRIPVTVALIAANRVLAETSANQFGEFQLKFDRSKNVRAYIYMPGRRPIGLPLPEADVDQGATDRE
jgi:hypothetical protein